MSDRDRMADALMGADVATLRRLSEERALLADTLNLRWATLGELVPESVAAQANDHRILAALALAIAEMQEWGTVCVYDKASGAAIVEGPNSASFGKRYNGRTLPAALASLLRAP